MIWNETGSIKQPDIVRKSIGGGFDPALAQALYVQLVKDLESTLGMGGMYARMKQTLIVLSSVSAPAYSTGISVIRAVEPKLDAKLLEFSPAQQQLSILQANIAKITRAKIEDIKKWFTALITQIKTLITGEEFIYGGYTNAIVIAEELLDKGKMTTAYTLHLNSEAYENEWPLHKESKVMPTLNALQETVNNWKG